MRALAERAEGWTGSLCVGRVCPSWFGLVVVRLCGSASVWVGVERDNCVTCSMRSCGLYRMLHVGTYMLCYCRARYFYRTRMI
jgi:hypothetical protein